MLAWQGRVGPGRVPDRRSGAAATLTPAGASTGNGVTSKLLTSWPARVARVTPPGGGSSREPVTQPLTPAGRWGHPARSMAPNPSPTRGRWDLTSRRGIPRMDESAACIQRQTLAQRRGRTRDASCTKDPKASMEAASTGGVETNVNSLDVTPLPRNPGRPGTGILILADHEQARARTARDLGDRGVGA